MVGGGDFKQLISLQIFEHEATKCTQTRGEPLFSYTRYCTVILRTIYDEIVEVKD